MASLQTVIERHMKQREAAERLGLTPQPAVYTHHHSERSFSYSSLSSFSRRVRSTTCRIVASRV